MVKVRDVLVPFGPNDINTHYYLVTIGKGEYEMYLINVEYATVLEKFTLEGGEWSYTSGKYKKFEVKYLDRVIRIWQYFVCLKLMPTRLYHCVDRERAMLIYVITSKMPMDIENIIHHKIKLYANGPN